MGTQEGAANASGGPRARLVLAHAEAVFQTVTSVQASDACGAGGRLTVRRRWLWTEAQALGTLPGCGGGTRVFTSWDGVRAPEAGPWGVHGARRRLRPLGALGSGAPPTSCSQSSSPAGVQG